MTTVALPVAGDRFRLEQGDETGHIDIVRIENGEVVGCGIVEWDGESVHIASLVVHEAHRRYGAGSEAAALLIDALVAGGAQRVTAWAPPDVGLAAYFWYRMGLHALHGPGPGGGILYERTQPKVLA
jgi:ribosomal protein S18 acetylase RimI-like enzyme